MGINQKGEAGCKEENIEFAWKIYLNTQDMIKIADRKISVLLVISGVMTTFIFTNANNIKSIGIYGNLAFSLFVVFFLVFLAFGLLTLYARKDTKTGDNAPKTIYFGQISERKEPYEYYKSLSEMDSAQRLLDLSYQIYEVSIIAGVKYRNCKRAWIALFFQTLCFVCLLVTVYIY